MEEGRRLGFEKGIRRGEELGFDEGRNLAYEEELTPPGTPLPPVLPPKDPAPRVRSRRMSVVPKRQTLYRYQCL